MLATPRLTDARILVVDERVNVVLLERILDQDGYRNVKSLTDPSEAVALFDQFEPDLVLLDLHLPDMPGQEVLPGSAPRPARPTCRWSSSAPTPARPSSTSCWPRESGPS